MVNKSKCFHCGQMSKVRIRDISVDSWEKLYILGEVGRSEINMPICDICTKELREVMIERRDEINSIIVEKRKSA